MSADGDQVGAVHHGDLLTLELSNAVTILSWWTWWWGGGLVDSDHVDNNENN